MLLLQRILFSHEALSQSKYQIVLKKEFKIGKFKEIKIESQLDDNKVKITNAEGIHESFHSKVFVGVYGDKKVAIKSNYREVISSSRNYFVNELLNLHLIHSKIDAEKSPFFAEFIGFTLSDTNDTFYGRILELW